MKFPGGETQGSRRANWTASNAEKCVQFLIVRRISPSTSIPCVVAFVWRREPSDSLIRLLTKFFLFAREAETWALASRHEREVGNLRRRPFSLRCDANMINWSFSILFTQPSFTSRHMPRREAEAENPSQDVENQSLRFPLTRSSRVFRQITLEIAEAKQQQTLKFAMKWDYSQRCRSKRVSGSDERIVYTCLGTQTQLYRKHTRVERRRNHLRNSFPPSRGRRRAEFNFRPTNKQFFVHLGPRSRPRVMECNKNLVFAEWLELITRDEGKSSSRNFMTFLPSAHSFRFNHKAIRDEKSLSI